MASFRWLAVAVASVGLAACGGGDDENNSQLSYADFGREANELCKKTNDRIEPLSQKATGEPQNDAPIIAQVLDIQEPAVEEFKKLKPPDELQTDYDTFVSVSDEQIAGLKEAEAAAKAGDKATYQAKLQELQPLDAESDAAASRLGAGACKSN